MANWVPGGVEYFVGPISIDVKLGTDNLHIINRAQEAMGTQGIITIDVFQFYIRGLTINTSIHNIVFAQMDLVYKARDNEDVDPNILVKSLKKFGDVNLIINRETTPYPTKGYIKHDFHKEASFSKKAIKIFIRVWDIVPDKNKNKYEVSMWEEHLGWCEECRDEHTMTKTIFEKKFTNKKEALLAFHKRMPKSIKRKAPATQGGGSKD